MFSRIARNADCALMHTRKPCCSLPTDLKPSCVQDYFFHKEGTANGGNRYLTVIQLLISSSSHAFSLSTLLILDFGLGIFGCMPHVLPAAAPAGVLTT